MTKKGKVTRQLIIAFIVLIMLALFGTSLAQANDSTDDVHVLHLPYITNGCDMEYWRAVVAAPIDPFWNECVEYLE